MNQTWHELTRLTRGEDFLIERVYLPQKRIAVEGRFEPPELARLTMEDQVFVAAFIKSHGSIKEMEAQFGISYPTVKNRLNRIASRLDFVDIDTRKNDRTEILNRLERGEITADEAENALRRSHDSNVA